MPFSAPPLNECPTRPAIYAVRLWEARQSRSSLSLQIGRRTGPPINNVQLVEPEPDSQGGNNSNMNASRVPFVTVGPATDERRSGTGLELIE